MVGLVDAWQTYPSGEDVCEGVHLFTVMGAQDEVEDLCWYCPKLTIAPT
jgi:hypothetical protein